MLVGKLLMLHWFPSVSIGFHWFPLVGDPTLVIPPLCEPLLQVDVIFFVIDR